MKLKGLRSRLFHASGVTALNLQDRIESIESELKTLNRNERFLLDLNAPDQSVATQNARERERLIREGKITPFSKLDGTSNYSTVKESNSPVNSESNDTFGFKCEQVSVDDDEVEIVWSDKDDASVASIQSDQDIDILPSKKEDRYLDDGDESSYQRRLLKWARERYDKRVASKKSDWVESPFDPEQEIFQPCGTHRDVNYGPGFNLPGDVHHRLFEYQRTCIRWLWELYSQEVGMFFT